MKEPLLEKDIERKVGEYAKANGCLYYKFTSPAHRAVPDRIVITPNGVVGFLELKREGKTPTPLQTLEIAKLQKHNAIAGWADSVERGKTFIDVLMNLKP